MQLSQGVQGALGVNTGLNKFALMQISLLNLYKHVENLWLFDGYVKFKRIR
jgi:hypothetical protein